MPTRPVVLVGAMNDGDVRMLHQRMLATFDEHRVELVRFDSLEVEKLQGNVVFQMLVADFEHFARSPPTQPLDELERAPLVDAVQIDIRQVTGIGSILPDGRVEPGCLAPHVDEERYLVDRLAILSVRTAGQRPLLIRGQNVASVSFFGCFVRDASCQVELGAVSSIIVARVGMLPGSIHRLALPLSAAI